MTRTHIIGAGMAGLACAVYLAQAGRRVTLHEAAPQAGGRCRSYHDDRLDRWVDNGNHLLLAANLHALGYLDAVGARHKLTAPPGAHFPFVDLNTGERWTVRPNAGRIPWWLLSKRRRVAGAGILAHLRGLRLATGGAEASVAERLYRPNDPMWKRLWLPLTEAIMNTEAETASAKLLGDVLGQAFARGADTAKPLVALNSLSDTFVDPALAVLERAGAEVAFGQRLRRFEGRAGEISGLDFGNTRVALEPGDRVVLTVPGRVAAALLPNLSVPPENRPIVNAHIRLPHRARLAEGIPFIGLIGGTAQWLFLRDDVASITVSAANALVDRPAEEIAAAVWKDTAKTLSLDPAVRPPMRVIKERRATFAATPEALAQRPGTLTRFPNLYLAGDWTNTALPSTIEGAIHSGEAAANAVLGEG